MTTSEARSAANRQNAAHSTGPRTVEGKEKSRQNALKHGLTGSGVVLPNEDAAEVERRFAALRYELQPSGEVAEILTRRATLLSVRLDRCVSHETASLSERIRQVEADFVAPEGVDAETANQLRAEAKARAMFDPSKEAMLARRYEAAVERGFFRALKELRQLRKESQAHPSTANSDAWTSTLASFSQFHDQAEAFEAEFFDEDLRTFANPSQRFAPAVGSSLGRGVDVPITIGRRC